MESDSVETELDKVEKDFRRRGKGAFDDDEESTIQTEGGRENKIRETMEYYRKNTKIKLKKAINRNVMFVGRSRVGKTTIINVLKDPSHLAKSMKIFADTMYPSLYSFTVQLNTNDEYLNKRFKGFKKNLTKILKKDFRRESNERFLELKRLNELDGKKKREEAKLSEGELEKLAKKRELELESQKKVMMNKYEQFCEELKTLDEINFNLNVIDTPGLSERREIGTPVRDNKSLKDTILTCLDNEIASIHSIFFVASVEDGVNVEDLEALEEFLKLFSGADKNLSIILTHSENKSSTEKKQIYQQLLQHKFFSKHLEKGRQVFFSGSNSFEDFMSGLRNTINETTGDVSSLREKLLYHIFTRTKPCPVREFNIIKDQSVFVKKDMEELYKLLDSHYKSSSENTIGFANEKKKEIERLIKRVFTQTKFIAQKDFELFAELQTKIEQFKNDTK